MDPNQIMQDMRNAKDESGKRIFTRDEWLTKSQIQGFFARLTSSRRKQQCADSASSEEWDEGEEIHQNIVDDVVRDIGVSHPIIYDTYDLCEYSRQDIMKRFNLKMLQSICKYFDLPYNSKTLKAQLIEKIKGMVGECNCSK